ncbi:Protein N-acetyltransferase, RimJ/RimL family [Shimia gijangensis]|uniref:Protein N-acetyltransferase, RimJ/RimL family n=1 Tax=Shimia gijangensis TaxID=1470563 RepID=A0A1M6JJ89_9RHOB|nr:GNAT family protein [Shimia gijangensis]SHJ46730.1 Protein N-acetyltransferase, RimJ/RimL family [Shimia gijangensis]
MWPAPVTLTGTHVSVVPLNQSHARDLAEATADGDLHKLWYTMVPPPEGISAEIERRLALQEAGSMLPFAILDASGKAVGMTTYMNIDAPNRRVEVGSTWYRESVQRGPMNTECKLLLLRHAFEELDCIVVEFRTHFMNVPSRRAIERLGAKLDGVLRSNMIMANGSLRDTAVYSILAHEWPAVRANLELMIERPR